MPGSYVLAEGLQLPGCDNEVPREALLLSLLSLLVAALGSSWWPDSLTELSSLPWLLALVPPFLLAYHKGWQGAAIGLAGGMALLILLQVAPDLATGKAVDWRITGVLAIGFVSVSLGAGLVSESLYRKQLAALHLAYSDPLTGLPNRRVLDFVLPRMFAGARRGQHLSVVLFDLDGFKEYNDQHGHQAGDEALRLIAEVVDENTRLAEFSGRFGGEEFLAILPGETEYGGRMFAERVRRAVERQQMPGGDRITISAGVAVYRRKMSNLEDLVGAADRALYSAKAHGGNQVTLSSAVRETAGP
ncbi:MAG: GGDEF domain-containing protein [Gemmatimonadota bacterium]